MKALVLKVYKDREHCIDYTIVRPAISRDSLGSYFHEKWYTPMMDIQMLSEDGSEYKGERLTVFATPDVIEQYTNYDLFYKDCFFSFESLGFGFEIEFEWNDTQYPYIKSWKIRKDYCDDVISKMCRIPKISSMRLNDRFHKL
jgi:hypothetical protein